MSANNAEIVKRFYTDLIAHGRLGAADDLLAPGYVDHEVSPGRPGVEGFTGWLGALDRAFRNRVVAIDDVASLGDFVSVRWSGSFTHSRAFAGYPPTGQTLEVSGIGVFRLEDDQIVEHWEYEDGPSLTRQLAVLTAEADHRMDVRALFERGIALRAAAVGA
jgi:predicted ester cyclase